MGFILPKVPTPPPAPLPIPPPNIQKIEEETLTAHDQKKHLRKGWESTLTNNSGGTQTTPGNTINTASNAQNLKQTLG